MFKKVDSKIEELKEFTIKTLSDLVSIPTVNPPGNKYAEISEYLADLVKNMGFNVEVLKVPKDFVAKYYPEYADYPRYNVIARLKKGKGPTIHFNGHYDVVPAGSGWSTDPFKPVVREGKMYGRGTTDMKGGIASIILAAKATVESEMEFNGTLELSFTPDEETGGQTGVGYLVETEVVKPDYAVVAEPSGLNNVWIGNKGAVWALIEVFGKQAHGSTPWLGDNAFEKMVKLANKIINELKPKIESKKSKYDFGIPEGAKATINVGGEVKGGAKINIVPGYYAFTVDRRVIPEETAEEAERELIDFVRKAEKEIKGLKANVKVRGKFDPALTDPNTEFVKTVVNVASEVLKEKPRTTVCIGGLDTRYFQSKGVKAVTYGPGVLGAAHIANEYVEIKDLLTMAKIYVRMVAKLLK